MEVISPVLGVITVHIIKRYSDGTGNSKGVISHWKTLIEKEERVFLLPKRSLILCRRSLKGASDLPPGRGGFGPKCICNSSKVVLGFLRIPPSLTGDQVSWRITWYRGCLKISVKDILRK